MIEFLGGTTKLEESTAVYLGEGHPPAQRFRIQPVHKLEDGLTEGLDLSRSLWDHKYLLAHLDIEYVNTDFPGEAYLNPSRTFEVQAPVVDSIYQILGSYGIHPLHLLSGRGHHFIWKIRRNCDLCQTLADLGILQSSLQELYKRIRGPENEQIEDQLANAFSGLGKIMEFLAHLIQKRAARYSRLPILLTELAVGPLDKGREMISIDLSEYGDPLAVRMTRLPFSIYSKPKRQKQQIGHHVADQLPSLFVIPTFRESTEKDLKAVWGNAELIRQLARETRTEIPLQERGMRELVRDYQNSDLVRYHEWFYSQDFQPPEAWSRTYDQTPLDSLPPCVRRVLEYPNDLLLNLSGIQLLTRSMLSLGWHPRHIAGLIRSKYDRDYGWGRYWYFSDSATRADFYVRLFSGLISLGNDELVDFTCHSTKEKGWCVQESTQCSLDTYKESLLLRKAHLKLGCQPFNRPYFSGG